MQRRAAAIYFAFFLVLAVSSYAVIAIAQPPPIELDAKTYQSGDTLTVDGQKYTVESVKSGSSGGGGHGGGGGGPSATIKWTNTSAQFTATLKNNSTVSYRSDTFRVLVPNTTDPGQFTLEEEFNVSTMLRQDPEVHNQTVTIDGRKHVTYRENNTNVPLAEYLPEPRREQFSTGDTISYKGNETTVDNVTTQQVKLVWTGKKTNSVQASEGGNVTLGNTTYVAHFPGKKAVALSTDYSAYQRQLAQQARFEERMSGFWAVVYLSGLAAVLIVGLAYMPVRG